MVPLANGIVLSHPRDRPEGVVRTRIGQAHVSCGLVLNLMLNPEDAVEVPLLEANMSIGFSMGYHLLGTCFEYIPPSRSAPFVFSDEHHQRYPAKQPPRLKPRGPVIVILEVQADDAETPVGWVVEEAPQQSPRTIEWA